MTRKGTEALLVALLATACAQDLSVHVRGGDRPPNPGYLVAAGGVDVDRFQLVVRNLRLQSSPTDGGVDTPGVNYLGAGPYLIDLDGGTLGGGTFTELIAGHDIGAHGYYEMNIDLAPVTSEDVAAVPALAPLLGKTFVITGRNAQGVPFTFESSVQQVLVRDEVFRMGMNHNNIDVNIAANVWFAPDGGGTLDPADPADQAAIEKQVADSIDAYEDDNMDGVPDPLG